MPGEEDAEWAEKKGRTAEKRGFGFSQTFIQLGPGKGRGDVASQEVFFHPRTVCWMISRV